MAEKVNPPFDWRAELIRMGIGQGPAFIVMVTMLWIMTSAIKDFIKIEIPKHIAAINSGYKDINTQNSITLAVMQKQNVESLKSQQATFEKALEHFQNIVKLRMAEDSKSNM